MEMVGYGLCGDTFFFFFARTLILCVVLFLSEPWTSMVCLQFVVV